MTMKKVNVSTQAIANVMLGVKEKSAIHSQSNISEVVVCIYGSDIVNKQNKVLTTQYTLCTLILNNINGVTYYRKRITFIIRITRQRKTSTFI